MGLLLALAAPAAPLAAQDASVSISAEELRAPPEIRDEHVLAQGRLTLPAAAPDPVGRGVTRLRASFLWGNSFSWTQDVAGENPNDRRFLIDGETRTLDLALTRGLSASTDLSLRVPLRWRGGGSLDGFIDWWHQTFAFLGIDDGGRPSFLENAFRVEGVTTGGHTFSWNDETGFGLGNVEVSGRWRFREHGVAAALIARGSLPTAKAPFEGSWGAGLQLVARRPLGSPWDLHAGVGGTLESQPAHAGITYSRTRAQAFAAVAWRPWRRLSLSVETNVASRLVRDIDRYPGLHWLIDAGAKLAASPKTVLELGLTENLKNQLSTTDLSLYFAVTARP